MKQSAFYLFAFLLLLAGCSNEIEIEQEHQHTDEVPVPIRIMPKWIDATTKTTIGSFTTANATEIGIFGTSEADILYKGISPSGINESTQQLLFTTPPLVYPVNKATVALAGYYPRKSAHNEMYTIDDAGLLRFTLTGNEDLMYAPSVNAGDKTTPIPVSLAFVHKLTCIKFKLINGMGTNLPSGLIKISTSGPASGTLDLTSGIITTETTNVSFILSTDLDARSLPLDTETEIDGELLLLPSLESALQDYAFKLSIDNAEYTIQIDNTNKPEWKEGVSYLLTITIKALNSNTKASEGKFSTDCNQIQGTITHL